MVGSIIVLFSSDTAPSSISVVCSTNVVSLSEIFPDLCVNLSTDSASSADLLTENIWRFEIKYGAFSGIFIF